MRPSPSHVFRVGRLSTLIALSLIAPVSARCAAPNDVLFIAQLDQHFQYGPFTGNVRPWDNFGQQGAFIGHQEFTHDSTLTYGSVSVFAAVSADTGLLIADLDSYAQIEVRAGISHTIVTSWTIDVYVRGAASTPYWIIEKEVGDLDASRFGGVAGSLQPVNGTATASFADTSDVVDYTGELAKSVNELNVFSGVTGATIMWNGDTYSHARTLKLTTLAQATQTFCALGCMAAADTMTAHAGGHGEIAVYPYVSPLSVPPLEAGDAQLAVHVWPDPLRSLGTIAFRAPTGALATVDVLDLRGALVRRVFDGAASGREQNVPWRTGGVSPGIYFVRVIAGGRNVTTRVALVR